MLIAERHQKIVELVNERNSIRVSELSALFSKTEETIRRDLEKLESRGKLMRSHGGAVSVDEPESLEISYVERELTNAKEKKQIAIEAVKHVMAGDKIILDASTTAWYMAAALPNIDITVLTNSIKVATELSTKDKITVISTGGVLRPASLSYVGPSAESSLSAYHVDKAFISCKGFHLERGMSESNEQQARVKEMMIDCADIVYIMVDYSKFGAQSFTKLSHIEAIDYVLTDHKTDSDISNALNNHSLKLITS